MKSLLFRPLARRTVLAALAVGAAALALPVAPAQATDYYRMSTLGPGTSPYMVMTTFANLVNKAVPDTEIQVNATGAATKHALDVAKGKADFFMTSPALHHLMETGKGMYEPIKAAPELSKNLRAVFNFPMGVYHATVYADSGIESFDDLKGKRVFAGPPGGAARRTMEGWIEAITGYKPGVDYQSVDLGWDAADQSFQDGHLDVYFNPTNAPSPAISQIALTRKVRFLDVPKDKLESPAVKAMIGRPGFYLDTLPAGVYGDGQVNTGAVTTLGVDVGIATRKDIPDDVIYAMTKAFWEGKKAMEDTAPWLRTVKVENVFRHLNMPVHPGALRYYQEIGLKLPETTAAAAR